MKFTNSNKSLDIKNLGIYVVLFLIVGMVGFLFLSPTFERNAPKIKVDEQIYWNLQKPISLAIHDDYGIKSYELSFIDGDKRIKLDSKVVSSENGTLNLEVIPPMFDEFYKPTQGILQVKVIDNSLWNFFNGNSAVRNSKIIIDKRSPVANVISNSYLLRQGGSGIIVVEINDENLKDYYVTFNDEVIFELFPFHKKNFYISIITWPIDLTEFKGVKVVAIDMAGNKASAKVPFYYDRFKEKVDNLNISDDFIYSVSKNVLELSNMEVPTNPSEIFVKANKDLRAKNLATMRNVVIKNFADSQNMPFDVKTFIRMTNAKTFAMFGERRHYFYNNEKIDEAWHLGMDWASVKRASIVTTNPGKVIFRGYLGIYGESIIIDHGLGIASLYAHTSSQSVDVGDMVVAGQEIGNTGSTGAVFGDHLHFGILIQGIEANPNEWLDSNWMKLNLTNTINSAIKIIDGNKK